MKVGVSVSMGSYRQANAPDATLARRLIRQGRSPRLALSRMLSCILTAAREGSVLWVFTSHG